MTPDELVHYYPRLYHMAVGGMWPMIQQHGLLPTSHIVTTSDLSADEQASLLMRRRSTSVMIAHPVLGVVTIRDQAPLREEFLTRSLTDMTAAQWLGVLNDCVFFWPHPDRLHTLLTARRYRDRVQDVVTIDTYSLVEAHHDAIRLCPINSGATLYPNAPMRGSGTFRTIEDYPFAQRRKSHSIPAAIAELTVIGGVPDLHAHVVEVNRCRGADLLERLHP
ncbi:hypothetical protein ABH935_000671 [Catenulispora sp. GAS73]|uniref:DUF7002 family protein n=1 Tax=Catenulispora sp. GAS73 TaxID=3156269 RepID=UPI003511C1DA